MITTESGTYRIGRDTTTYINLGDILRVTKYVPQTPALVAGEVTVLDGDDGVLDGKITLTQDLVVTDLGELTLDVLKVSDLAGGHNIDVAAGGKIKLTHGHQVVVKSGTKYKIKT